MICAVVLAAGRSARMGAQKLLLPLDGKPMITRIVDAVLQSGADKVFVVVGRDAGQVRGVLPNRGVTFVTNPDAEGDMLTSVRCGVRALPPGCNGVLIVLGDQPGATHELIGELIRCFRKTGQGIIVPKYQSQRGHPLLFAAHFCDEVLTKHSDTGLRGLLLAHPEEVIELPVASSAVLEDLDTPEDYARRIRAAT